MAEKLYDDQELEDLIMGKGHHSWCGPYFHTHPGTTDDAQRLHEFCERMAAEGKLTRRDDGPRHTIWTATT